MDNNYESEFYSLTDEDGNEIENEVMDSAVIDGVEIDSGVAAEIGAFSMLGRPIVALCSDVRQQGTSNKQKIEALKENALENQFIYRNLFVVGLIKENGVIVSTIEDVVREVLARR